MKDSEKLPALREAQLHALMDEEELALGQVEVRHYHHHHHHRSQQRLILIVIQVDGEPLCQRDR